MFFFIIEYLFICLLTNIIIVDVVKSSGVKNENKYKYILPNIKISVKLRSLFALAGYHTNGSYFRALTSLKSRRISFDHFSIFLSLIDLFFQKILNFLFKDLFVPHPPVSTFLTQLSEKLCLQQKKRLENNQDNHTRRISKDKEICGQVRNHSVNTMDVNTTSFKRQRLQIDVTRMFCDKRKMVRSKRYERSNTTY